MQHDPPRVLQDYLNTLRYVRQDDIDEASLPDAAAAAAVAETVLQTARPSPATVTLPDLHPSPRRPQQQMKKRARRGAVAAGMQQRQALKGFNYISALSSFYYLIITAGCQTVAPRRRGMRISPSMNNGVAYRATTA